MITKGATDWNDGLYGACRGGNLDIVRLMINKGANYWNDGLCGACRGGHMNIVQLMDCQRWKFRYSSIDDK